MNRTAIPSVLEFLDMLRATVESLRQRQEADFIARCAGFAEPAWLSHLRHGVHRSTATTLSDTGTLAIDLPVHAFRQRDFPQVSSLSLSFDGEFHEVPQGAGRSSLHFRIGHPWWRRRRHCHHVEFLAYGFEPVVTELLVDGKPVLATRDYTSRTQPEFSQ